MRQLNNITVKFLGSQAFVTANQHEEDFADDLETYGKPEGTRVLVVGVKGTQVDNAEALARAIESEWDNLVWHETKGWVPVEDRVREIVWGAK